MKKIDQSVEHYCRTADEYYQKLPRPSALLHKPFMSLIEAANSLAKAGPLLEGLHLGHQMTVLDFGAGTCWLSRYLALLGCEMICLDVSQTALQLGETLFRYWPSLDVPSPKPRFLLFDGRRIDLPDKSVDRVVCFEALHHVPNPGEVLAEIYRVLKDGGVAGFAEPGEHHSETQFSKAEMLNYDVLELDIVMSDIWAMAQRVGFTNIRFRLFSFPTVDMSLKERNATVNGSLPPHIVGHIRSSMSEWSIFFLHKGDLRTDSRGTFGLQGQLKILEAPGVVSPNRVFEVRVRCINTGETSWLGTDSNEKIGTVAVGPHLYDKEMRLINFEVPRRGLPKSVEPGESYEESVPIPPLPVGDYVLTFDLVAEFVTWFEALGTVPVEIRISVR